MLLISEAPDGGQHSLENVAINLKGLPEDWAGIALLTRDYKSVVNLLCEDSSLIFN